MAEPMIYSDDEHSSSDVDTILAENPTDPQITPQQNTRITRKGLRNKNDRESDTKKKEEQKEQTKGKKKSERKSRSTTKKGPKAKASSGNRQSKVKDDTQKENQKPKAKDSNQKVSPRKRKKQTQSAEANKSSTKRPNRRASLRKKMTINTTSCSVDTNELVETAAHALKTCKIVHDLEPCSHLIMENPSRTLKTLLAIARGAWILSPAWVLTSLEKGRWVEEEPFETKAFKGASQSRKCTENDEKGILGTRHQLMKLLKSPRSSQDESVRIYVAPNCEPEPRILKQLIEAAGGEVVDAVADADVSICPKKWSNKQATVRVKPEWLFDSIASYEIQQPQNYSWK